MSYSPRTAEQLVADVDRHRVLTEPERHELLAVARGWCARAVAGEYGTGGGLYDVMRVFVDQQRGRLYVADRSPLLDPEPVDLDEVQAR